MKKFPQVKSKEIFKHFLLPIEINTGPRVQMENTGARIKVGYCQMILKAFLIPIARHIITKACVNNRLKKSKKCPLENQLLLAFESERLT